jgi:GcrA cell cycle regulator
MVWNEETIRQLRVLWSEGHSTAEIGRRLGVSKNAIVGKAHRLDLDARPSPIRRDASKPAAERPVSYPKVAGPTLPPLASAVVLPVPAPEPAPAPVVARVPETRAAEVTASQEPAVQAPSLPKLHVVPATPPSAPSSAATSAPVLPPAPALAQPARPMPAQPPATAVRRSAPACCWPIGEPGTKSFRFCDQASLPGKPYCDDHARLAYVRIRDRKEDAA